MEAQTETWIGAFVVTAGGLFAVLKLLIEKKYDAKFLDMKSDLALCKEQHENSESDRAAIWAALQETKQLLEETKGALERANARAEEAEKRAESALKRIAELESKMK